MKGAITQSPPRVRIPFVDMVVCHISNPAMLQDGVLYASSCVGLRRVFFLRLLSWCQLKGLCSILGLIIEELKRNIIAIWGIFVLSKQKAVIFHGLVKILLAKNRIF